MDDTFLLLLKPASYACNLRCKYCFYQPAAPAARPQSMSLALLQNLLTQYWAIPMAGHTLAWQGGEPTLMELDFYQAALAMQEQLAGVGAINNVLQTNGTLLDDEWGEWLARKKILTGISLDGPETLHDCYRRYPDGRGSYKDVRRGLGILQKHGVDYNVLTLVSAANQAQALTVYRMLRDAKVQFQQYIECVEFDAANRRQPFALAEGQWGEFLCNLFDEWYKYDTERISIRLFDSILSRLTCGVPTLCQMSGVCDGYLVVEADGSVYPCDFHVKPQYLLGNIGVDTLPILRERQKQSAFFKLKKTVSPDCMHCRWQVLCLGDCPRVRQERKSVLCRDWQQFYEHTITRFELLAAKIDAVTQSRGKDNAGILSRQ